MLGWPFLHHNNQHGADPSFIMNYTFNNQHAALFILSLHVSGVSAAHHQEVACIYVTNGTCYTSKLTVSRPGIAQSVWWLATGLTVRGSNPVRVEIFRTRPDRPWDTPSLLHNGNQVFPGGKAAGAWRWPPTPYSAEVKEKVE
jgi:hypothetical protein